eukprot:gene26489-biopygen16642
MEVGFEHVKYFRLWWGVDAVKPWRTFDIVPHGSSKGSSIMLDQASCKLKEIL